MELKKLDGSFSVCKVVDYSSPVKAGQMLARKGITLRRLQIWPAARPVSDLC